jgi:hypothetical protein
MCCSAMYQGIRACGDRSYLIPEDQYRGPQFPLAVFYGYTPTLRGIMADYVKAGLKAVYIDLGYWHREGMRGYHKLSINARHPTHYFQRVKHKHDRAQSLGVVPMRWREVGQHILLAGMGDKAANVEGRAVESWEREAIEVLRRVTGRKIIYRPKPSWLQARPIPGTLYSPKDQSLESVLHNCHAVVTHHSNVAVDGLVAGVPAFCWHGVAAPMSCQDLKLIENPMLPGDRAQWIADIAYTQWSVDEMQQGRAWRHLKDEDLIR